MRLMGRKNEKQMRKLVRLADGDVSLVNQALKEWRKRKDIQSMSDLEDYIRKEAKKRRKGK